MAHSYFILAGLVISCYISDSMQFISPPQRAEIIKYLFGKQESAGGWGLYFTSSPPPPALLSSSHPRVLPLLLLLSRAFKK
jgi:hypothetical protein